MAIKDETELYAPIKALFTERGYDVKAEVRSCDLVALHPDRYTPTIVEMKKIFTLPLLLQGVDRQKTGAEVWLAVERNRTKKGAHNQRFTEITSLCRRLGLGFITVTFFRTKDPVLEIWCEPAAAFAAEKTRAPIHPIAVSAEESQPYATASPASGKRLKKAAQKLINEFNARSGDYNVGGSTKRKLITAYRERAIQCALALHYHGAAAPRQVKTWTGCPNAATMLRSNYYGWFKRISKGVYELAPSGQAALIEYAEVTAVWAAKFPWADDQFTKLTMSGAVTS
ncbi:MAG: DUF2161 family putative PD-(D/E)XK-type phosphodiesterase [Candidatus Cohnella colombiensis]|uniref:DUF2161 family putative PD-(D/E)XK-type phosphodiesterase n=1 Tax=Candidatus Cohnella colombiensis TaxID=3121368 RepID=A0AA95F060_9BACL|nr:MAG: DUF2161 family putative PD-(D/E)XK-type phosphodiesterase [Cohnella sp.]